jgi:hypothetical protein
MNAVERASCLASSKKYAELTELSAACSPRCFRVGTMGTFRGTGLLVHAGRRTDPKTRRAAIPRRRRRFPFPEAVLGPLQSTRARGILIRVEVLSLLLFGATLRGGQVESRGDGATSVSTPGPSQGLLEPAATDAGSARERKRLEPITVSGRECSLELRTGRPRSLSVQIHRPRIAAVRCTAAARSSRLHGVCANRAMSARHARPSHDGHTWNPPRAWTISSRARYTITGLARRARGVVNRVQSAGTGRARWGVPRIAGHDSLAYGRWNSSAQKQRTNVRRYVKRGP